MNSQVQVMNQVILIDASIFLETSLSVLRLSDVIKEDLSEYLFSVEIVSTIIYSIVMIIPCANHWNILS